jgi:hypothetical protein
VKNTDVSESTMPPIQVLVATLILAVGQADTTEPTITVNYKRDGAPKMTTILGRAPAFGPGLPKGNFIFWGNMPQ